MSHQGILFYLTPVNSISFRKNQGFSIFAGTLENH